MVDVDQSPGARPHLDLAAMLSVCVVKMSVA